MAEYEALKLEAGDREPILFMDAVHPTQSTKLSGGWIRRGERKPVKTTGSRTRMNIIGALSLNDIARTVTGDYAQINARTICEFFRLCRINGGRLPENGSVNFLCNQKGSVALRSHQVTCCFFAMSPTHVSDPKSL